MRELWIDLSGSRLSEIPDSLMQRYVDLGDVILLDSKEVEPAKSRGVPRIAAEEYGDIIVVPISELNKIRELKSSGSTIGVKITVKSEEDLKSIPTDLEFDYLIVDCPNWKIIPTENLIALGRDRWRLIVRIDDPQEAEVLLETLEIGADGVIIDSRDEDELTDLSETVRRVATRPEEMETSHRLPLTPVEVVEIRELGMGARVCVDTCNLMTKGEGMLVGCQSSGLFLVQAEVEETVHVTPRPFRVNAGPVSSYIAISDDRTQYLSELKGGDELILVDREGRTRKGFVGRVKIELRPMLLVVCRHNDHTFKSIVQNAETVRYVTMEGSKAVTELAEGDEILVWSSPGGRHFGTLVEEETILEY